MMRLFSAEVLPALICYAIAAPIEVGALITCSCYNYTTTGTTWDKNRNLCIKAGQDLVSMETDEEWEFIMNAIQMKSTVSADDWHIGLYKNDRTGNWTWVSGKPLTIQQWQPGKPDNHQLAVVTVIAKSWPPGSHGKFDCVRKEMHRAYICENVIAVNSASCPGNCWTHSDLLTTIAQQTVTSSSGKSNTKAKPTRPTTEKASSETPVNTSTRLCSDVIIVVIPFTCVTLILMAVIVFLVLRLRRKSKMNEERDDDAMQMKVTRKPDENAGTNRDHQEPFDRAAPALYQALGENRWESSVMTYASLSEASREHIKAAGAANEDDCLLSPYEEVEHTRKSGDGDYENMPNV